MSTASKTPRELAAILGGELDGEHDAPITSVAGLREAGPSDLSFLNNTKYAKLLKETRAGAVLVAASWEGEHRSALIRVENPDAAFAKATELFRPAPVRRLPGTAASAVIGRDVVIGKDAHIGENVVIADGVHIGDRCEIHPGVVIGEKAALGSDVVLHAGAVLREHVILGDRVIIHNNAVIGSDGFGYSVDAAGVRTKVPQVGIVRIGDDVEIGACVCVDRARFGETRIGNGVKIDNLVQIAHNVVVQDHAVIVSQTGISGSSVVGRHAILAGQVGVAGHLTIGEHAVVGAQGGVTKDVPPKTYVWGTPAQPFEQYSKSLAHVSRLPKLQQKVAALEARIAQLENAES
ncbi:MAG: UDP-3-O-(3-hydroxymyristoyl)glucosamine N-acyltransferase [Verrucomicrobia bacterium]|nr:UDP-3-O-(3-hydroxymyristoyl)glucosamine N-acyltransferase [Verrucomicrobiota bacterium]MCH8527758.1 UDP-3-O-(3-hydroxymyristoyl)glucosamine N-acyltransferase [Kiritimatiellia bacterium]